MVSDQSAVSVSLCEYGEWAQIELDLLLRLLPEGGVAIDAGAGIGAHAVAFAGRVGPSGRVLAFEPRKSAYHTLVQNVAENALAWVETHQVALAASPGSIRLPCQGSDSSERATAKTLDHFHIPRCNVLKIDVYGMEFSVLQGAIATLERCRPIVYLTCGSVETAVRTYQSLQDSFPLRMFVHQSPLFNPANHRSKAESIFGGACETAILAVFDSAYPGCAEILAEDPWLTPVRNLDELVLPILDAPRFAGFQEKPVSLRERHRTAAEARLTQQFAQWKVELDEAQIQLASAAERGNAAEAENNRLRDQVVVLESEIRSLRSVLKDEQDNSVKLNDRLRAVELQAIESSSAASLLAKQLALTRGQFSGPNEEGTCDESAPGQPMEWRARLQKETALRESLAAEKSALAEGLIRTSKQLAAANEAARASREELERLRAENADLANQVECLLTRMNAVNRENLELRAHQLQHPAGASFDPVEGLDTLFDPAHYASQIEGSAPPDLLAHYISEGWRQGLDPHPLFQTSLYLANNPDVAASGMNPLLHYLKHGGLEGRCPHPLFDGAFYLRRYSDVRSAGVNPLLHYLWNGWRENRDPHILFHTAYYLSQDPGLRPSDRNPLEHFISQGWKKGLNPNPHFDCAFYLDHADTKGQNPLVHYICGGERAGCEPHWYFSPDFYYKAFPSIAASGVSALAHFVEFGREAGLLTRPHYDLASHHPVVVKMDEERLDGKPCILFVSHVGGGGTEKHITDLAQKLRGHAHVFLLQPANHFLWGPSFKPLLALSSLNGHTKQRIFFDPFRQIDDMIGVVRAIGVTRVHVHHLWGNEGYLRDFLSGLRLPWDVTIHDFYLIGPQAQLTGPDGRYVGGGDENSDLLLGEWKGRFGSLSRWRQHNSWLVEDASRVITPSVDARDRLAQYFPRAHFIAASHPELWSIPEKPIVGASLTASEPLRICILGQLSIHKGADLALGCARFAEREGLPLHFTLRGYLAKPQTGPPPATFAVSGRYDDAFLLALLQQSEPHVIWFPALWPETYSYTLSAALLTAIPLVVPDIGAFPERVAGRPWSWVAPWDQSPADWCEFFLRLRERLLTRKPPPPPALHAETATPNFYEGAYLTPQEAMTPADDLAPALGLSELAPRGAGVRFA